MRITIAERLRPYSHTPGTSCVLPGSSYCLQIFPGLIRIYDLSLSESQLLEDVSLHVQGPLKDFTVLQDLEKGEVRVWGHTTAGFIRYRLISQKEGRGIQLYVDKAPVNGLPVSWQAKTQVLQPKEALTFLTSSEFIHYQPLPTDRLSLGNHKAQDWDLVKRRLDLKEILPVWNRIGQLVPQPSTVKFEGTAQLLISCQEAIASGHPERFKSSFVNLFQAGFEGILSPRLKDNQFQGIVTTPLVFSQNVSPLLLLTEGVSLIRRLFLKQEGSHIWILPNLPPEFSQGRWLQASIEGGKMDLEWTKKFIRRLIFYSNENQELSFHFRHVKQFRLRRNAQDKGQRMSSETPILLEKNCYYLFDNFA